MKGKSWNIVFIFPHFTLDKCILRVANLVILLEGLQQESVCYVDKDLHRPVMVLFKFEPAVLDLLR